MIEFPIFLFETYIKVPLILKGNKKMGDSTMQNVISFCHDRHTRSFLFHFCSSYPKTKALPTYRSGRENNQHVWHEAILPFFTESLFSALVQSIQIYPYFASPFSSLVLFPTLLPYSLPFLPNLFSSSLY